MVFSIDAACGSFLGNGRTRNEDNFLFDSKHLPADNRGLKQILQLRTDTGKEPVFAVFDGMGGEKDGHEASFCASRVFREKLQLQSTLVLGGREFFEDACLEANRQLVEMTRQRQVGTMGTTVAALRFFQGEVVGCNVGDSRIYRVRDNTLFQLSQDHTDQRILEAMGIDKKPVLLQYLGMSDEQVALEPYISRGEVQPGDRYILCSDGVTDVLSTQTLLSVVGNSRDAEQAVQQLLRCTAEAGGTDNATVTVITIEQ